MRDGEAIRERELRRREQVEFLVVISRLEAVHFQLVLADPQYRGGGYIRGRCADGGRLRGQLDVQGVRRA